MQLLLAETFYGSAGPKAVHEVCFKVPVRVVAVRIVGQGEAPHPELSFQGQTPDAPFVLELFGAMRGKGTLCAALLSEPHRHETTSGATATIQLVPTEELLDYVVIRCGHAPHRAWPRRPRHATRPDRRPCAGWTRPPLFRSASTARLPSKRHSRRRHGSLSRGSGALGV